MRDDSATGVLAELNEKRRRWRRAPLVFVLAIALFVASSGAPGALQVAIAIVGVIAITGAFLFDVLSKTTVLMYDLDEHAAASYQALVDALAQLGGSQRIWHITSRAAVLDRKYHAGAQSEIRRSITSARPGSMAFVKCNLDVPKIPVGRQTLFFLPDRLLVFESGSVGGVSYSSLELSRQNVRFIESEGVPRDSRVVDRTWRYVNKGGGPDRRFKDNSELPICEYEAVHFSSTSGLNELLYVSRVGAGDALSKYLTATEALAERASARPHSSSR
jgi:hypothetical protein